MARLTVYFEDKKAAHYDIKSGHIRVGRHPKAEIFLADPAVSRQQLAFDRKDGFWVVEPGRGKVNVFLNGEPLTEPTAINEGGRVQFGQYAIRYSEELDDSDTLEMNHRKEAVLAAIGPVPRSEGGEDADSTLGVTPERLEEMRARAAQLAQPYITWKEAGEKKTANLGDQGAFIGKGDGEIQIPGGMLIHSQHARIAKNKDGFLIAPCSRWAKTLVNGAKLSGPRQLRNGDEIQIGGTKMTYKTSAYDGR